MSPRRALATTTRPRALARAAVAHPRALARAAVAHPRALARAAVAGPRALPTTRPRPQTMPAGAKAPPT
ncbi:MAG: hypothetical protein ABSH27_12340 [Solirubrobacteraceae bacterium]|jgi:hypothetical protein